MNILIFKCVLCKIAKIQYNVSIVRHIAKNKKVREGIYLKELFVKNVVNKTTEFLDNNQRIKLKEILTEICIYYRIEKL